MLCMIVNYVLLFNIYLFPFRDTCATLLSASEPPDKRECPLICQYFHHINLLSDNHVRIFL